ncbi:hypothetical protein [Ornithinimicrobium cryptoxanthini]|uniref:hypothetical protein n=1 Tax=Ornithinimicrobium cryptoxanthini TaxID=2934161 RepID=UPI002117915E|nr:hypothetical protein [Ornithinimicrobium cryptoxanthini]
MTGTPATRALRTTGTNTLSVTLGRVGGGLLAALFGLVGRARGTRALHPVGVCGAGALHMVPGPPSGVALLDSPGPHDCRVRWSRAAGRRHGRDVEGMAVRVTGAAAGDVLFASTGTGVVTRHMLTARAPHRHGSLTTLLPLSTARGSLLLRLDPVPTEGDPPTAYRLLIAAPGLPWHERGTLEIRWSSHDCTRRHDPVGQPLEGTWTQPIWSRLRDPSYAAAQQVPAVRHKPAGALPEVT